jgi:hypothetical protein
MKGKIKNVGSDGVLDKFKSKRSKIKGGKT